MIFYEAILEIKNKDGERRQAYSWSNSLDEVLELEQRKLAMEHQIVFHLRSRTLVDNIVIKLASKRTVDAKKLESILSLLFPEADITAASLEEITYYYFWRSSRSSVGAEARLFQEMGVEGAMNLEDAYPHHDYSYEFICPEINEDEYAYQSASLKEEIQRIQSSAQDEFKPGNPAHYAIHTSNDAMMYEFLSVLVDKLFSAKRLISRRIFRIDTRLLKFNSDKSDSEVISSWIEPFCLMSEGGVILVKVPYISFGFSQSPKSEFEMNMMRYLSVVEKLFSFNKGKTQFVFAFDPVYSNENIELALTEIFPNDQIVPLYAQGIKMSFVREFLEAEARRNHIEVEDSLFASLEKKAEYSEKELRTHLEGWSRQRLIALKYPEYNAIRPIDVDRLRPEASVLSELDKLIGLAETKKQVKRVIANIKLQEYRHREGLDNKHPCLHMMFTGNPGTGKTTVARLIGEIFVSKGIIPCGKFFEVSSASLKEKVSWSETFEQARGSVLFIDEAYTLGDGAIDQLVPYLENYREDTVVIFAGYKKEMNKFLGKNSGLASRIPHHIDFPNYSPTELTKITDLFLIENNYTVSAHTRRLLQSEFRRIRVLEGNARDIRTVVEKAISEAAQRLSQLDLDKLSLTQLRTLEMNDFTPTIRSLGKERRRKVATNIFGSPFFTVPATHAVKLSGQVVGAKLTGKTMTRKETLALVPGLAISIGTDLVMNKINKASKPKNC